ncbi:MAG: hypothetical protein KDA90_20600, partial [Planctomycetaceae bacterium]|nr:hypothetical protein [Planctomycetaceae bacterium]
MFRRNGLFVAVLILTFPSFCCAQGVLLTAKAIAAEKYADWTYGSATADKQIDCVQFVLAVSEVALSQTVDSKTRQRILISDLGAEEIANLPSLIASEDERIKGIQTALISIQRGEPIEPKDAKPGDLVQYWMQKSDGTWFGHAGILEQV